MQESSKATALQYVAGLFLTIVATALGNLLAHVLTAVWGWQNLDYDKPGGVALSAVQGALGAGLAAAAGEKFLKPSVTAFWLKITVIIFSASLIILAGFVIFRGRIDFLLQWSAASALANVVAIEFVRRIIAEDMK